MIYELRTYTLKPGAQPFVAQTSAELGRDIRGDNYGHLEGYWLTEIGALNQVVHMWSFESFEERARLRAELSQNTRWTGEYIPRLLPNLVRQEVRIMNAFLPIKAPKTAGNIYELRCYRARPTKVKAWAQAFTNIMPVREKYSECAGAWICESGQPNEVCHLWAYADLNTRVETRARVMSDPEWQGFLGEAKDYLEEMHSTIMLPATHSRMQ
jgi:hypothetical protein